MAKKQPNAANAIAKLLAQLAERRRSDEYAKDFPSRYAPPVAVKLLPTLDKDAYRPITPMLAARFAFAGRWTNARVCETWLDPAGMEKAARKRSFREYHAALREHWEGSAPERLPDTRLSLFAVDADSPDHLVYLAWPVEVDREPAIHCYSGQHENVFRNLAAYLKWMLA
jgi:hypothetical protein